MENIRQIISGIEQKFNFVYDNGGRRERLKSFNGASLVTETIYGFDNASRLLEMKHLNSLSQILEQVNYGYDANGNRTNMNRPSVNLPTPNPVTNTSYNEANQMLSFNDKNIVYDNNGNMTSVTNSCGTTNYTWDVRNRLVAINGFNTDCTALTASFKYDALGRRIEKTINGRTIQYLYDGLDIVQEIENGAVSVNYIRTLNIDEPLARIKSDGTVRYYQQDALGSVIALTDDNGIVKTTYSYDPFGNVTISGEASDNPFQFAGRENDGTGHLFERYRYYSLDLLRYISQDPIGIAGGDVNYYVRVGNNPVNFVDPLGLAEWLRKKGDPAAMGSVNAAKGFRPNDSPMKFFEYNVPNFYETSIQHDAMLNNLGIKNAYGDSLSTIVNIVTMPIAFKYALDLNIYEDIVDTMTPIYNKIMNLCK